jgi:hypothetical protein
MNALSVCSGLAVVLLTATPCHATSIALYGHTHCTSSPYSCSSPGGWNSYGGDILMGQLEWTASDGAATFFATLDPGLTIFGFSFNTTTPDVRVIAPDGWLQRSPGTDHFDITLLRADHGYTNTISFQVQGIASDADVWRPNIHYLDDGVVNAYWELIMHQSHVGIWAADAMQAPTMVKGDGSVYTYGYMLSDAYWNPHPVSESGSSLLFLIVAFLITRVSQRKG